jgi:hypothetical protein
MQCTASTRESADVNQHGASCRLSAEHTRTYSLLAPLSRGTYLRKPFAVLSQALRRKQPLFRIIILVTALPAQRLRHGTVTAAAQEAGLNLPQRR